VLCTQSIISNANEERPGFAEKEGKEEEGTTRLTLGWATIGMPWDLPITCQFPLAVMPADEQTSVRSRIRPG
jgi:hypothetical protein